MSAAVRCAVTLLDTVDSSGAKTPSGTGTGVAGESREGGHREGGCGHLLTRHRHIVPGWVGAVYSIHYRHGPGFFSMLHCGQDG